MLRGYNERFKGPTAGFWGWPIGWPSPAVLVALAGLKMALLGLCGGLAMLAGLGAGLRCLFSPCIQRGRVYGIAYGLAYGIALAWLALSVWLSRDRGGYPVNT